MGGTVYLSAAIRLVATQPCPTISCFIAAMIFIAHPIHTEAVANIKGRDELMAMLFSLGALYGAIKYMDNPSRKWMIISMCSYFLGLLSKENAITFFAIIPVSIYFFSL